MSESPSPLKRTLYLGRIIHCKDLNELETFRAVAVDENGVIVHVEKGEPESEEDAGGSDVVGVMAELRWSEEQVAIVRLDDGEFLFPGFIGIFGKSTLLDWLETYTFPLESSLKDLARARRVYGTCIARTLSNGTTTASYYATVDVASTNLLSDLCLKAGQRAFIGRCVMDSTLQPEWYRDATPQSAVQDTIRTIEHVKTIDPNYSLVSPIITPRFAPSCTSETLSMLGSLAKSRNLPIQTHISENKNEIKLVAEMFPDHDSYTDVYDKHDLLTPRTILAHAIHLSQTECDTIKARQSKISHCPASNSAITSGTAKVRWLLNQGIEVGLGTDMSGGYSPSILEAVRQALLVSRHVAMEGEENAKLSVEECLYLATRGGAKVVGLENRIGGFEVGMEFDAQLVRLGVVPEEMESGETLGVGEDEGPVDVFGWEKWEDRIAKWVFGGDDRNTSSVWVKGRLVHRRKR